MASAKPIQTPQSCPQQRVEVRQLPNMLVPRTDHNAYFINGEIVVLGGHTTGFIPTPTAERYSDGGWQLIPMTYPHDQGVSLQLSSGKVMIGGGHEQSLGIGQTFPVEFYDPENHTFNDYGCFDRKRCFAGAIELEDGQVVITGNWYAADGVEYYDGKRLFSPLRKTTTQRSCPYLFRIASDDAIIFSRLDTCGHFLDSIAIESVKGKTVDVPLFSHWHPYQFRPEVFISDLCFIGDASKQQYAYLLPVENDEGELAIAKVEGTAFSLLPTTCPIPRVTQSGEQIFYAYSYLLADRQAGRAYFIGHDRRRIYVLGIDYASASADHPAPLTLFYTDSLDVVGDNASVCLTPEGDIILTGGMDPDNFTPTGKVYEIKKPTQRSTPGPSTEEGRSFPLAHILFGTPSLGVGLGVGLLLLLSTLIIIIYKRMERKKKASVVEASAFSPSLKERGQGGESDTVEDNGLMMRIERIMTEQKPYLRTDLKITSFAEEIGAPMRRVSETIKAYKDCTFVQYINGYRVDYAKRIMSDQPQEKLSNIYKLAGFASESSFFRSFKSVTGMTPADWAEKVKN